MKAVWNIGLVVAALAGIGSVAIASSVSGHAGTPQEALCSHEGGTTALGNHDGGAKLEELGHHDGGAKLEELGHHDGGAKLEAL